jgi:hypothetical protein
MAFLRWSTGLLPQSLLEHPLIVMAGKAVFDNIDTLTAGTFFYLCLGK